MATAPKATRHRVLVRRGRDVGEPPSAESDGGLTSALSLLSTTRVRVSIYRFVLPGVDAAAAAEAVDRAFGRAGLVAPLADGSIAWLFIRTEPRDAVSEADVAQRLWQALASRDLRPSFEMAAMHRSASEIGSPEDFLLQLVAMPTRPVGGPDSTEAGPVAR